MAAGAFVVAPARGGPRSYVDHGSDGLLCDTLSPSAVRASIVQALALASSGDAEQRVERASTVRRKVRRDLSIDTMAASLAAVYHDLLPSPVPSTHAA